MHESAIVAALVFEAPAIAQTKPTVPVIVKDMTSRYWQAVLAGHTLIWWRETRNPWLWRIVGMEAIFLLFFGQWYANRYYSFGVQLPFGIMVALILGLWFAILAGGWWWDRKRRA